MTEQEWLSCEDPDKMLEFVEGKVGDRKLRLFACACCRSVWHLLTDAKRQETVELAERYADGAVGHAELARAHKNAMAAVRRLCISDSQLGGFDHTSEKHPTVICAIAATKNATFKNVYYAAQQANNAAVEAAGHHTAFSKAPATFIDRYVYNWEYRGGQEEQRKVTSRILRDIVGLLPFHPSTLEDSWLSPTVTSLAQCIYDERSFEKLPILADALEDNGCCDQQILGHLRSEGPHVRGCWPLDLVLQKE